MKFLWLTVILFAFCLPVNAQKPGTLDTSFRIQTNYGPNRWPEKASMGPDGSVFLYSPRTLFSGRKTGPIIKLKPNGDLDTGFVSKNFDLSMINPCDVWPCSVPTQGFYMQPLADGSLFCQAYQGIYIVVDNTDYGSFRLLPDGKIDTAFHALIFSGGPRVSPLPDSTMLALGVVNSVGGIYRFFTNGKVDTTFHPAITNAGMEGMASNLKGGVLVHYRKDTSYFYRRYLPEKDSLSAPFGKTKGGYGLGLLPIYLLALSESGAIYEQRGKVVRKRKSSGILDSSFAEISFSDYRYPTVDGTGRILLRPYGYPPGLWIVRHDSTGHFIDSIPPIERTDQFLLHDTLIRIGPDSNNRWAMVKQKPDGSLISHRSTRFGLNNEVSDVLIEPDGAIAVAGSFSEFDTFRQGVLVKIKHSGKVDTTFQVGAFRGFDKRGKAIMLSRFTNGDYLVVTEKKYGKYKRFLHRVRLDGSIDTVFGKTNLSDFSEPIIRIEKACRSVEGKIWLVVRQQGQNKASVLRLLANGTKDPDFNPFGFSLYPDVSDLAQIDSAGTYIAFSGIHDDPSGGHLEYKLVRLADTSSSENAVDLGSSYLNGSWKTRRISNGLLTCNGFELKRYSLNMSSLLQTYTQGGYLIRVTKDQEILAIADGLFKMNIDGERDTAFASHEFNGGIYDAAEQDSTHLYLFGGINQYGQGPVSYICRIHNRKSDIALGKNRFATTPSMLLFPNPARNEVYIHVTGGYDRISFFNAQGQLQGIYTLSKEPLRVSEWPSGIYFWRATGPTAGAVTGRFLKE